MINCQGVFQMKKAIKQLQFELRRNNPSNFIFELLNQNTFDEERFYRFIGSIVMFAEEYSPRQDLPEEDYFYYINEIVKLCEDTLWAFIRHYRKDDAFVIKNFDQIEDKLTQYYMYIREYTEKLILNVQE